jgi:outer membrane protein TolC
MAEQSAEMLERDLIRDAKRLYAMLSSARRRLDVNQENQRLLGQLVESVRVKYSVGLTAQGDVLKVQVELAKLHNERAALQQELSATRAMMNALRSAPPVASLGDIEDMQPEEFRSTLEPLLERSLNNRADLRAMTYEIEMNKSELGAAQRMRLPELMLRGTYKQVKEGTDQWAAMVGINIPVAPWGIGKYSGRVEESELNVRASEQSLADMQNIVRAEVTEAYTKVQSLWQQIDTYRQTILPRGEQLLQSMLPAYQTDNVDFLSLLDTYRLVQMFKMEYIMVVGDYFSSLAELERAVGSDLR